jgi:amino acid adenylation domain-containing protein
MKRPLEDQVGIWHKPRSRISSSPLRLPTDRPRGNTRIYTRHSFGFELPVALALELRELSRQNDVTLFATLLSGWAAALCRWSGQGELAVGTSARHYLPGSTSAHVGPPSNLLALGVTLEDDPTVRQLTRRVNAAMDQANAHAEVPFESGCAALHPTDESGPVCQVTLEVTEEAEVIPMSGELQPPDAAPQGSSSKLEKSPFELSLSIFASQSSLVCRLVYASELFDSQTVRRLAGHWEMLLQGMVSDADEPVSHLPLLTRTERNLVLHGFNKTEAPYPHGRLINEVFEEQVRRRPDAVAVVCDHRQLTYKELNRRANQLAHHLRRHQGGPDKRVALCVERGIEMIVGLVGILKAGGAYVPLDPSYPAERLQYMLNDCKPVLLLTLERVKKSLPANGIPVFALDSDWSEISGQPVGNPAPGETGLTPENLAYVIYTSGSTGTPKGVMVEHRSVTRFLAAANEWFHFDGSDVWAMFHSFAFDFSVLELWGALLSGSRLVIVPYAKSRFSRDLYVLLSEEGVSVLTQTPSAFRGLIAARARSPESHSLKTVILGGEALQVSSLRPWYERDGDAGVTITNMYGPTETTVFVTYRPVQRTDTDPYTGSVIGTPIPHSRIYILDENRQPVPVGVTGEIYIGGTGVARGYLNRPELTAERFVVDPFAGQENARMYRSGDLGRWRLDGHIDYLGRNDSQVKVRGFRMELGDIEAHLLSCASVKEAVVLVREDRPGDAQLVAYLTEVDGEALSVASVRSHLLQRLPVHMVPNVYLILESFPLNANGKLDRKSLPTPDFAHSKRPVQSAASEKDITAPQFG